MLRGGEILKETCTIFEIILAIWQSKKRCWMISSRLQKQHFILPLHCRRARLSLVRTTPFCKYHIKILIFKGSLNFRIKFLRGASRRAINVLYMDRTVKWPFCVRDQKRYLSDLLIEHSQFWLLNCAKLVNYFQLKIFERPHSKDSIKELLLPSHSSSAQCYTGMGIDI